MKQLNNLKLVRQLPIFLITMILCFGMTMTLVPLSKADDSKDIIIVVTPVMNPTSTNNNYTEIYDVITNVVSNRVIDLQGTFDWTETHAYNSYLSDNTGSERGIMFPTDVDDVKITSTTNDGQIIGPGEILDSSLIAETFIWGDTGNADITIENLTIQDFELPIGLGWNTGGGFHRTVIQNNTIELSGDSGNATEWLQNIAILLGAGQDQKIINNTIVFQADGTRTEGYWGPGNGSSLGFQSNTHPGDGYDGLVFDNNIFQLASSSNGLEKVTGIWDNHYGDGNENDLVISNNQFVGRSADDFDYALRLSTNNASINNNLFTNIDLIVYNRVYGGNPNASFIFSNNNLSNVGGTDGIFLVTNMTDGTDVEENYIHWHIDNTIDGETGIRGLNELSTQATHASRPESAATKIDNVMAIGTICDVYVDDSWPNTDRFSDPDGIGTGLGPMAFSYNVFDIIQAAVDQVCNGGAVYVNDGTFNENILLNKHANIIGSGSGSDGTVITQDTAGAGDTHIGVIQLNSSGASQTNPILLKNLRVEPVGMAGISVGRFYQDTETMVSYVEINNMEIIGTNSNPSTEQERGLYVDTTSTLSHLIVNNSAFNNLTYGWYFQKQVSADASTVEHVTVSNTEFNHNNHKGIYAEKLANATFTGCTISENGFNSSALPSYFAPWSAGIDFNLKSGTYDNFSFENCAFTDNAIDEAKEGVALTIKERGTGTNPSSSYISYPANCNNVTVTACNFTNNERGMRFGEPGKGNVGPTNVTVAHCNIVNNEQHYSGTDGSAYGGLINQMQADIMAECNWWNDIAGPSGDGTGSGDAVQAVVGTIDFLPWLNDVFPDGDCLGGYACWNMNTSEYFTSIQAAIDDDDTLDGHTIQVFEGEFAGALVNKSLKIIGSGENTIITSGVHYGGNAPDLETAFLLESGADESNISDFSIACNSSTDFFFGIFSRQIDNITVNSLVIDDAVQGITNSGGSNWTISNNKLTDTEASGGGGIGIYLSVRPPNLKCNNNLIQANTISSSSTESGYTAPGICLALDTRYGAYDQLTGNEELTNNVIINNTILGTGNANEVGIETGVIGVSGDSVKIAFTMGMIHDNSVIANDINGSDYGIYAYVVEDHIVEENEIKNCVTHGISIWENFTGSVNFNNIYGSGIGFYNNLTDTVDATCNWWGDITGPAHTSNPGGLGNNVTDFVDFIPWLTDEYPYGDCIGGCTVHNIDTDEWFMKIQSAIDDVDTLNGHTIEVGDGIYYERVVVNKELTLQAGSNPVVDGYGGVCISLASSNVTIDGFELMNGSAGIQGYIGSPVTGSGYQNVHIINNIIHDIVNTAPPWGFGIYLGTEGERYWSGSGMYDPTLTSFMDFTGLLIENNTIYQTSGASLVLQSLYSTSAKLDIIDNEIYNGAQSAIWIDSCWDLNMYENYLHNCANGLFLSAYSDGYYETNPNQPWDCKNIDIIGNDIQSNTNGVELWDGWPGLIFINQNNIIGNTNHGIHNYLAENVSGTCNWWGDINGPTHTGNPSGTGDSCSDFIFYTPWLDNAYPDGNCTGGTCFDPIWVDDDAAVSWYDEDHVATIQLAVDRLCDGGTIYIEPGTYNEDLNINKSLTMIGSGDDQTFVKSSSKGAVFTITADYVTIKDLEITDDNQLIEGIRVTSGASTGFTIENVDFTNLGNNPGPGNAYGLVFDTSFTDFNLNYCDFTATNLGEYSRAIAVFAGKNNGYILSDINVENSTFTYLYVGIYISAETNGLYVKNNNFGPWELEDCAAAVAGLYMGDGKDNYDIENIVVTGNTFTEYGRGIYSWNYAPEQIYGAIDISDNTFADSIWSAGIRFYNGYYGTENISYQGPITIHNNVFTQSTDVGANVALIDLRTYSKSKNTDISIKENEITFLGSSYVDAMYGIQFVAAECPFNNTLVENNSFTGGNVGGAGTIPSSGIAIRHYSSDYWPTLPFEIDILTNEITGFDHAVSIYDEINTQFGGLPTGSLVNVNYNNIFGNSLYGIRNNNSETVNAECNWWGDISGPSGVGTGIGDAVTAHVDFIPWLDDAYPDGDCVGGTCADPVWVDDDAASSWYDWDHVGTIQTALDRVCVGGTVYVAAGNYVENIVVDKSVYLIGDGRDTTIVQNSNDSSQVYTIKIDGNLPGLTGDVLVEGFTFNGSISWNAIVATDHIPSGITLTFQNNRINDGYLYGWWDYHSHGNLEMHNNIVSNVEYGLMFEGWDTGTINIGNNDFQLTPGYFGYPAGMFHFTYDYLNCTNPYNIYENTFSTSAPGYGVVFYGGYGSSYGAAQYTDVTIVDNEFNAIGYYGVFLRNYGPADENDIGGIHNAFVAYNNFTDCSRAVLVYDNNSGINVNYNNFIDTPYLDTNEYEIPEYSGSLAYITPPESNTFDITDFGIQNTGIYEVDGTCNWWGDATGPYHVSFNPTGLGCNVSDTVAFMPWLDDAYPYGDCSGGAIVHNINSDEWFLTIQEAIDDTDTVNGDTLEIIATTHAEGPQIVISKDVTITGQGCSSTIIVPTGNTGSSGDTRGWWLVNDGIELHLSNLKLDGTGYNIYQGIRHKGSGTIDQVCFNEIKYPSYGGVAVAAFGGGPVDITNCQFTEIGRIGVLYWVTDSLFEGNTYVGKGDGDWLDYCLDIGGGGGVSVIDNTISDCTGLASSDGSESAGVMVTTLYGSGSYATIEENDISDCTMAIAVGYDENDTSSVTANYNNFFNCEWGISSTAPVVDGTCNWWGDILGPYHDTENPMGLGCNVSDNVTFIPWLTDEYPYGDCDGYPGLLTADFSYNPNNPSPYETITFTDLSTVTGATIINWTWTFGDGDISYLNNPTHQYTAEGNYPVTLTVIDDLGHTDTISKLVPVGPIQLAANLSNYWNIVSLPFNESVNKIDILIKYDGAYYSWSQAVDQGLVIDVIYGWDESIQSYEFVSAVQPGKGYWLFAYVDCELWVNEITAPSDELITDIGTYWNLIGLPFDQSIDKIDVIVRYNNVDHTWNEAATDGIVIDYVYGWNADIQSYEFANTLVPGKGYWLFAFQQCRLKRNI